MVEHHMEEKTLELKIPLLIPGLVNHQDNCLEQLENALQNQRGILRAHIENEQDPLILCLHYNPSLISIEDVRRIGAPAFSHLARAGFIAVGLLHSLIREMISPCIICRW